MFGSFYINRCLCYVNVYYKRYKRNSCSLGLSHYIVESNNIVTINNMHLLTNLHSVNAIVKLQWYYNSITMLYMLQWFHCKINGFVLAKCKPLC